MTDLHNQPPVSPSLQGSGLRRGVVLGLVLLIIVAGLVFLIMGTSAGSPIPVPTPTEGSSGGVATAVVIPQPQRTTVTQPGLLSPEELERLQRALDRTHLPGPKLPEGTAVPQVTGTPTIPESQVE